MLDRLTIQRILKMLQQTKLSCSAIARRIGVSHMTVSRVRAGKIDPDQRPMPTRAEFCERCQRHVITACEPGSPPYNVHHHPPQTTESR